MFSRVSTGTFPRSRLCRTFPGCMSELAIVRSLTLAAIIGLTLFFRTKASQTQNSLDMCHKPAHLPLVHF